MTQFLVQLEDIYVISEFDVCGEAGRHLVFWGLKVLRSWKNCEKSLFTYVVEEGGAVPVVEGSLKMDINVG